MERLVHIFLEATPILIKYDNILRIYFRYLRDQVIELDLDFRDGDMQASMFGRDTFALSFPN